MRTASFAHLALWRPALRVLCYHRVHPDRSDRFTVAVRQLDEQLSYLRLSGFSFIHARDLLAGTDLPPRPLLLTFDDGYVDNLEHAQPVLQRHRARATIFVVTGFAGDRARWDRSAAPLMSAAQLRQLDPSVVELALHSHTHRAFGSMSMTDIEQEVRNSQAFFAEQRIPFTPALAYPYGSRPKHAMTDLSARLAALGVPLGFRIGNRLNRLPLGCPHEIQRIDVSGTASRAAFRCKLWFGKLG